MNTKDDEHVPLQHSNKANPPTKKKFVCNVVKIILMISFPSAIMIIRASFLINTELDKLSNTYITVNHIATIHQKQKFLLYFNHAGFTNQLRAIERASALAAATNRTLVLPPVLQHCGTENIKYDWACSSAHRCPQAIKEVKKYALKVASGARFPSFTEVVDFDLLLRQHPSYKSMSFIDLPAFMTMFEEKYVKGQNASTLAELIDLHFYSGDSTALEKILRDNELYANETIKAFNDELGDNEIAVIGSGFKLNRKIPAMYNMTLMNYPPQKHFLKILKRILQLMPTNYIGAHIRIRDRYEGKSEMLCQSAELVEPFTDLINQLKMINVTKNETVYLGLQAPFVKVCLVELSNDEYKIVSLPDLFNHDNETHSLMNGINLEWETVVLVLDQLLLSLSKQYVQAKMSFGASISTFQKSIKKRHSHRQELLSLIENV